MVGYARRRDSRGTLATEFCARALMPTPMQLSWVAPRQMQTVWVGELRRLRRREGTGATYASQAS